MEDSLIKTLGRWESDAYQRYIKLSRRDLAQYSKTIASSYLSEHLFFLNPLRDSRFLFIAKIK